VKRSDQYSSKSESYAAAAEAVSDPGRRIVLMQMAQHWARLAEIARRYDSVEHHAGNRVPSTGERRQAEA
jgi:hypothetical protein